MRLFGLSESTAGTENLVGEKHNLKISTSLEETAAVLVAAFMALAATLQQPWCRQRKSKT